MKNILLLVSSLTMIWTVHATDMVGTVKTLKGTAQIERGHERIDVTIGTHLRVQDKLTSGPASSVGITLSDSTLLTAGPNSTIELSGYAFDRQSKAGHMDTTVKRGMLNVVSGQMAKNNPDQVVYRTNTVTLLEMTEWPNQGMDFVQISGEAKTHKGSWRLEEQGAATVFRYKAESQPDAIWPKAVIQYFIKNRLTSSFQSMAAAGLEYRSRVC